MKTDTNGCSTCHAGQEQYEQHWSEILHRNVTQYDYRAASGELFSTVQVSLDRCRAKRNNWLKSITTQPKET